MRYFLFLILPTSLLFSNCNSSQDAELQTKTSIPLSDSQKEKICACEKTQLELLTKTLNEIGEKETYSSLDSSKMKEIAESFDKPLKECRQFYSKLTKKELKFVEKYVLNCPENKKIKELLK